MRVNCSRQNFIKSFTAIIIVVFFVVVLSSGFNSYAADVKALNFESFSSEVNVSNENLYTFNETFVYNGTDEQEKTLDFVRVFPEKYKGRISDVSVKGYKYIFDADSNTLSIHVKEMGVNSRASFEITYTVDGLDNLGLSEDGVDIDFISGSFYNNIDSVKLTVRFSENLPTDKLAYMVGDSSDEINNYGKWNFDEKKHLLTFKGSGLTADVGIYAAVSLPAGYFANATDIGFARNICIYTLLGGILLLIVLRLSFRRNREIQAKDVRYAPEGLPPAHMGYIIDNNVNNSDITSMFFYMAQNGYIRIEEYGLREFRFVPLNYPKSECKTVRIIYELLFDKKEKTDAVTLEQVSERLEKNIGRIKRAVIFDIVRKFRIFSAGTKLGSILMEAVFMLVIAVLPAMNIAYFELTGSNVVAGWLNVVIVVVLMELVLQLLTFAYYSSRQRKSKTSKTFFALVTVLYIFVSAVYVLSFRFAYKGRIGDLGVATLAVCFLIAAPLLRIGRTSRSKMNAKLMQEILGLKEFIMLCSKSEVKQLNIDDPDYFFKNLPYAYVMNIGRKFAGSFEYADVKVPDFYKPYRMDTGQECDIVVMNSMIVNLDYEMSLKVFKPTTYIF